MLIVLLTACAPGTIEILDSASPTPGDADVAVDVSLLDFGDVAVGTQATLTVTVSNTGESPLTLSGLTLADASAPFTVGALGTDVLDAGASTSFDVTFDAESPGTASTKLYLTSDDPDESVVEVQLIGITSAPGVAFDPATYDFGDVAYGCSDTYAVSIRDDGTADLVVTDVAIDGGEGAFAVDLDSAGNGPLPWTLAPGESQQVWVTFEPPAERAYSASLVVQSDDPSDAAAAAALDGTGVADEVVSDTWDLTYRKYSYELSKVPWPDSIVVSVDGTWDTTNWAYEPGGNLIRFTEEEAPEAGSEVIVTYDAIPTCN